MKTLCISLLFIASFICVAAVKAGPAELATSTGGWVRVNWSKFFSRPSDDQWYKILSDDRDTEAHWVEAADHIVLRMDVQATDAAEHPNYISDRQTASELSTAETWHLAGDGLRNRKNPSVSDLLSRRAYQLLKSDDVSSNNAGIHLGFALACWDGRARLADLQRFSRMIMEGSVGSGTGINSSYGNDDSWMTPLEQLCETRMVLGDRTAVSDYIGAIKRVTVSSVRTADAFAMFWRHYDIPEIKSTAELLFDGEGSRWNPEIKSLSPGLKPAFWNTPMLGIPAYRRLIIRLLQNNSSIGSIIYSANGDVFADSKILEHYGVCYNMHQPGPHNNSFYYGGPGNPPFKPNAKTIYRMKDSVALSLSTIYGFPDCEAHWRLADKDAVANKCIRTLEKYGPAITHSQAGYNSDSMEHGMFSRAKFSFPQLKQPATLDQVARGDALFSIEEAGTKRVVGLRKVPVSAQLLVGSSKHPKEENAVYLQVWQAEEVQTDQGIKRYYGVVGPHFIGKIPAESVRLLDE